MKRGQLILSLHFLFACQTPPTAAPAAGELPSGIAARVGTTEIRIETVARIAAAQLVDPREARERAVFDALTALESRRVLSPPLVQAGERSTHARALLESLARGAEAKGPPDDAEIDELLKERWVDLDRPESVRVVHAVALLPADGKKEAARALALDLQRELEDIGDPAEFLKRAEGVPKGGLTVRAEGLPAITADGRGWRVGPNGSEAAGSFDPVFTRAAHALHTPGDLSNVVETRFGFHLILLVERLPEQRIPRDEARRLLVPDVVSRRAERERRALIERLQHQVAIEVSRNFDALTSGLEPGP
jgi:peptidyl-prolyl cis-trans isomerase C